MLTPKLSPADVVKAAVARIFPMRTALQRSHGDIREATARRWGIPVVDRRVDPLDVVRPALNRADRRRQQSRETVLSSYSRTLTRRVAP